MIASRLGELKENKVVRQVWFTDEEIQKLEIILAITPS
jgi:hypothetical protein